MNRKLPRPQFALRTLVLGGLLIGTVSGLYGPKVAQAIRVWLQTPSVNVQQPMVLPMPPKGSDGEPSQTGYYESGETPLQ